MKRWDESKFGIDLCWNASWLMSQQGNIASDTNLKTPPKCTDLPDSNQLNHHCVKGNSSRFPVPPTIQMQNIQTQRRVRIYYRKNSKPLLTSEQMTWHVTQILNGSKSDFRFISQCRIQSCWNACDLPRAWFLCSTPLRCWFSSSAQMKEPTHQKRWYQDFKIVLLRYGIGGHVGYCANMPSTLHKHKKHFSLPVVPHRLAGSIIFFFSAETPEQNSNGLY